MPAVKPGQTKGGASIMTPSHFSNVLAFFGAKAQHNLARNARGTLCKIFI
jgi:hypothetical protein